MRSISLQKDGLVHCYIEHLDCYYPFDSNLFTKIKIKNMETSSQLEYCDYRKCDSCYSYLITEFDNLLKNNNSRLTATEITKIDDNLKKLQTYLPIVQTLNENVLCEIADSVSQLIEKCEPITFKQNLNDEILCRTLKDYSDEELERVLIKRKSKVKKINLL